MESADRLRIGPASAISARSLTLPSGIQDGAGRVKLGGRQWHLRGPDVPAGARVRVTGVDGSVLIVDRLPT